MLLIGLVDDGVSWWKVFLDWDIVVIIRWYCLKKFCYELFVIYKVKYLLYMLNFMDEWLSRERGFKKVLVFECMNFIK